MEKKYYKFKDTKWYYVDVKRKEISKTWWSDGYEFSIEPLSLTQIRLLEIKGIIPKSVLNLLK